MTACDGRESIALYMPFEPETNTMSTVVYLVAVTAVSLSTQDQLDRHKTHVAPARTSSIVRDRVNPDSIDRYVIVENMIITIRTDVPLIRLQMTTGNSKRAVIKTSKNARAMRLIKCPEYK